MPAVFVLLILVLSIAFLSHSFYSCLHVMGEAVAQWQSTEHALFEQGLRGNPLSQLERPGS